MEGYLGAAKWVSGVINRATGIAKHARIVIFNQDNRIVVAAQPAELRHMANSLNKLADQLEGK